MAGDYKPDYLQLFDFSSIRIVEENVRLLIDGGKEIG